MTYKTKIFLQSVFVLTAFAIALQAFAVWVPPIGTPPTGGNTEPPINTSSTTQAKDGGIVAWSGLRSGTVLVVDGTSDLKGNVTIFPGKTLTLNTETYSFPANQTANGYLKTDGAGNLTWDTSTGGVSDGDKGDITVSGSGATWTIDALAVTNAKIAALAIDDPKIAVGAVSNTKIADLAVGTSKVADDAITYAKLQNVNANSFLANTTGASGDVQAIATNRIPLFASTITGTPDNTTYLRGDGSWASAGGLPGGTLDYTLRYDGTNWVSSGTLRNTGTNVGVGVSPAYKFHVLGETRLVGVAGNPSLTAMSGNVGIGSSAPLELLSVGNNTNGNLGVLSLSNAVSGRVIIQPNSSSFTTYTLTLPSNDGNANDFLQTNGSGVLTWAPASGGITGSGSADKLTKWTGTSSLGNTTITEEAGTDDIGIATGTPGSKLSVLGNAAIGTAYSQLAATANGLIVEGNVGIGESNPTLGKLVVKGGDIAITNSGTAGLLKLYEPSASGTNFSAFKVGAQTSDLTYTLPSSIVAGGYLQTDVNGNLSWAAAGGVTTIGAIDSQAKVANGAVISGVSLYMQTANASFPGLVSTGVQTFAGAKTFSSDLLVNTDITVGKGGASVATNTAVGYQALLSSASGATQNTALGYQALKSLTGAVSGDGNTAVGYLALDVATTGFQNTAIGNGALGMLTSGSYNIAIGSAALEANLVGINNVGVGYDSLGATTGSSNTAVGQISGLSIVSGSNNVTIGYDADVCITCGAISNGIAIGYQSEVNASNKAVIGNASVTTVGGYGTWTNYSDIRLKENVYYKDDLGLNFIMKLKTASYNYKADENKVRRDGLIAQDVQKSLQELGLEFSGLVIDNDKMGTMNLSYESFVIPLINSVQELKTENDNLKKRLETLEAKIK